MSVATVSLKLVVDKIKNAGLITDKDVTSLRQLVFGDMIVSAEEATEIFSLSGMELDNQSWSVFFVESMTDYLVNQADPSGYITTPNADWLVDKMSACEDCPTALQIEALVSIVNKARTCPDRLSAFAIEIVKKGVLEGHGALRNGAEISPGSIGAAEVDLLRLVLYGVGGDGGISISRTEAEMLFELNDIVGDNENHPAWADLFSKAVANFLMAAGGYQAPSREEVLRSEKWLADERTSTTGFLSKALVFGLRDVLKRYQPDDTWKKRNSAKAIEIAGNEIIDAQEAQWLIDWVNRDGVVHENERKLLRFIKENSPKIHPSLLSMLDKVA